jgi:hypothetical protein
MALSAPEHTDHLERSRRAQQLAGEERRGSQGWLAVRSRDRAARNSRTARRKAEASGSQGTRVRGAPASRAGLSHDGAPSSLCKSGTATAMNAGSRQLGRTATSKTLQALREAGRQRVDRQGLSAVARAARLPARLPTQRRFVGKLRKSAAEPAARREVGTIEQELIAKSASLTIEKTRPVPIMAASSTYVPSTRQRVRRNTDARKSEVALGALERQVAGRRGPVR